jgi:hypothetical protein
LPAPAPAPRRASRLQPPRRLQVLRNSFQVWPLVVPAALAAFQSAPHSFITLSALAALAARPNAPASNNAARPVAKLLLYMVSPLVVRSAPPLRTAPEFSCAAIRRGRAIHGIMPLNFA